jgi:hypothetical protein
MALLRYRLPLAGGPGVVAEAADHRSDVAGVHQIRGRSALCAAIAIDQPQRPAHHGNRCVGICAAHRFDAALDGVGLEQIVGIQEQHEFGVVEAPPGVVGGTLSAIVLSHRLDARAEAADRFPGVVGRTVVDHHHPAVAIGLGRARSRWRRPRSGHSCSC